MNIDRATKRSLAWVLRGSRLNGRLNVRRGTATAAAAVRHEAPNPLYPASPAHTDIAVPLVDRREAIRQSKPFSAFLTDNFDRQHDYLRISITERCNLRCLYCMPEEGVQLSPKSHLLTSPEIFYLSSLFVSQGVTKIRLTGGEPTVRPDILPLMKQIGALREYGLKELALTTNGISLHRKLDEMVEAGLTGVNISLDTLDPYQFQIMTRRKGFDAVMRSIEKMLDMKAQGVPLKLKINCVIMRGINDAEIVPFVELARDKDIEVRFIEYMPFDGNKWNKRKMVPYQEMLDRIRQKYPSLQQVDGHRNDTSKTWEIPGFVGKFGFITSMTHNFCGTCNRLRITSDGNLKVCLFGNSEVSLRDMLRKDNDGQPIDQTTYDAMKELERSRSLDKLDLSSPSSALGPERETELLSIIGMAVKRKKEKHAGIGELENMKNRPMILIDEPPSSIRSSVSADSQLLRRRASPHQLLWSSIPSHLLTTARPSLSSVRMMSTRYSRPPQRSPDSSIATPEMPTASTLSTSSPARPSPSAESPSPASIRLSSPRLRKLRASPGATEAISKLHEKKRLEYLKQWRKHENGSRMRFSGSTKTLDFRSSFPEREEDIFFPITGDYPSPDLYNVPPAAPTSSKAPSSMPAQATHAPSQTSPRFSHIAADGQLNMVDISAKHDSYRVAAAIGTVSFSSNTDEAFTQIAANSSAKGNIFTTAQIAGIQAAKLTSSLIPLCHPVSLSKVHVELQPQTAKASSDIPHNRIKIVAVASTVAGTGVEMEALTAVMGAALTIVDMCKAVDKGMTVQGVQVIFKSGGRSGVFKRSASKQVIQDLVDRGLLPRLP